MSALWVKVCGITTEADADMAVDAGADAVGLNLWPKSVRGIDLKRACSIAQHVRGRVAVVAVCVDFDVPQLQAIASALQPDWLQLHGNESDDTVRALGPKAFRAIGLHSESDVARAQAAAGSWVLVDAYDEVNKGGTGRAPPAALAEAVCRARPTILAGGLGPDNVAAAVRRMRPAGVDATSQLESAPGRKDKERVVAYVQAARGEAEHV